MKTSQEKKQEQKDVLLPSTEQIEAELAREQKKHSKSRRARNAMVALAAVFAGAVLLSMLVLPLYRIYGDSMTPTLEEGDVVMAYKTGEFKSGDLVVFSYNNKTLVKRVIAVPGDWVDIDDSGNVSVNGQVLDESYLHGEKSLGQTDIQFPYQVPEGKCFVLGDHRSVSVDSRLSQMGAIPGEQIVGKVVFRIWPLASIGGLE
ncbi:signal peptidase I [Olsenella sp. YH-ols2221]|uniref:signal peptidase I n=1 Tax=Olsenella kribbiana TaxID=3115221 RepID=UPI002ED976A0